MNDNDIVKQIVQWLIEYPGYVVGVSGGVDSALVSTLCAKTNKPTILVSMPILQPQSHLDRAHKHIDWLKYNFSNVISYEVDLTEVYETFKRSLPKDAISDLALVNDRSRLRMTTLYNFANSFGYVVVGTGNKVEDYGVGFFTKYGDGGVDISPIGDLLKTDVWRLSTFLGVCDEIVQADPTDGLWNDNRSDEDQIGATYPELEEAMKFYDNNYRMKDYNFIVSQLTERQKEVLQIYTKRHESSLHKMSMPPICKIVNKE